MKQKILTLFIALLTGITAWAHDFVVDGIYYKIISSTDLTVSVSYRGSYSDTYSNEYSGAVVIPESVTYNSKSYSVTSIGSSAFSGCSGLTSVVIPSSVTSIPSSAFYGCSGLTSVVIPSSVTSIGERAFEGCSGLTSVVIPSSVTSIGNYAFYNCSGLTSVTIPEGVTSIGYYAFYNCSGLTSVTIPSSVTSIDDYAFNGCTSLKNLTIEDGSETLSLGYNYYFNYTYGTGNGLFYDCPLESVYLGRNISYNSIQQSGYSPFYNKSGITELTIGAQVTSIGNYAFSGCSGLTSVVIPGSVTSIGSSAFDGCSGVTCVVIPSSVTSIGERAFYNVTKAFFLTNTKPSIGSDAFKNCKVYYTANNDSYGISGTHKVYSLLSSMFEVDGVKYIPTSMSQRTCDMVDVDYSAETVNSAIGPTVKYTNSTGRQYDFKVNKVNMYAGYGCKALSDLALKNEGEIEEYAFYNSSATAIDVDNTVTTIGDYAFSGCAVATSITASNNGNIGDYAFSDCAAATSITASNNGNIGNDAFRGCTSATSITASNNGTIGAYAFSGCMTTGDGTIKISNKGIIDRYAFQNCTKATSIDINNEGSLGESAFSGCSGAREIKISDKITSIGSSCFSGCSSLLNITIPKLITTINSSTFYGCSSLTSVTLNNAVTSIGSNAFKNCSKLASLTIPANVANIASGAFDGCTSIGDLTFEDSETAINLACKFVSGKNLYLGRNVTYSMSNASPFSGNNILEKVTTNMNVTSVPNYEFYNCKSLKDVYLSDAVTSVGTYAFSGDIALTNFEVGISVESIGAEAFSDCTALLEFTSHSIVPATVGTEALDDIDKLECTLHVPEGTEDAYAAADQWKEFWIDGDLLPRYKVVATVDPECAGMGTVKGSNGYDKNTTAKLEAVPAENYVFVEWSDGNKQNPRTMTVTGATNLTAKFAYRYYIKTQPTANNISVALSEMVSGVVYKWYVSESAGGAQDITNDLQSTGSYAWSKSGGVWTSGNKGVNNSSSTLSMNITAKAGDKLTFDYSVSSESGYDRLSIYLGSSQIGSSYSGSASGKFDYTFSSDMNTTLKFVYSKDGSQNDGSDQATISNVIIEAAATLLEGETTGAVSVSSLEKDKYYYCEITMPDGVVLTSDQVQYVGGDVKTYTISVTSANGTVTGAGTYVSGATVVLDATPATGYRFVRWSDGNTTNPRTITVTGNVTLSAVYEAIKYVVSVTANNGSVSGAGEYPHGSSVTISATPATGYRFVRWSDGNTSNPRAITVTSEVTLSAVFEQIKYKITLTATNGAVSGAGTYAYGTSATILATPATGYKFVSWSDGNTTNPRVITVSDNLNLEAVFTKESTPEVVVGGSEHGSAGVTEINGNSQTITVTPDKGYIVGTVTVDGEDVTDKMTGNTYIINNVTVNVNVTVVFISIAETAKVSASAGGNVEAVEYDGDKIVLSVTPDAGYEFDAIYVNGAKIAIYNKAASSIMGEKNLDGTYSISGLEENAEIVVNFKVASITTPIGSITADKPSREGIYDLMGRKLSAPQRGINIIDGKKVIVK